MNIDYDYIISWFKTSEASQAQKPQMFPVSIETCDTNNEDKKHFLPHSCFLL